MIHFICPHCGKGIRVKEQATGKKGKCPGCGETVEVPTQPRTAALASPGSPVSAKRQSDPQADLPATDDATPDLVDSVESVPESPTQVPPPLNRVPCPFCGELIASTAVKCRFCTEFLDGRSTTNETVTVAKRSALENLVLGFLAFVGLSYAAGIVTRVLLVLLQLGCLVATVAGVYHFAAGFSTDNSDQGTIGFIVMLLGLVGYGLIRFFKSL